MSTAAPGHGDAAGTAGGPPHLVAARLVVRRDAGGLSAARELVGRCCGLSGLDDEAVHVAVLLASEVVTNAARHGGTEPRLSVLPAVRRVRVEVADDSRHRPAVRSWTSDGASGRGMALVDVLAARWGVTPADAEKVVWFEVAATGPAAAPAPGHEGPAGELAPR